MAKYRWCRLMVSRTGMARTSWWMCVLDRAQKIKSAVGGCRGEADVETHCVRYTLIVGAPIFE